MNLPDTRAACTKLAMTNAAYWALVVSFLVASPVFAQDNGTSSTQNDPVTQEVHELVPAAERTESTKHHLAQCLVGESDWARPTEYAIISHILVHRWRLTGGRMTLDDMITRYCAVHHVAHPSRRQQWVRRLPDGDLAEDPGFPDTVNWRNYITPWRQVREFVDKFMRGHIENPMPRAKHWGSVEDGAHIRGAVMLPRIIASIEDGQPVHLANCFYDINPALSHLAAWHPTGHGPVSARLALGRGRIRTR